MAPELTTPLPLSGTASSGLKVLCRAKISVEPLAAERSTPLIVTPVMWTLGKSDVEGETSK